MAKPENENPTPVADQAPPGFRQVDTDVDNYPAWNFASQGELAGRVHKAKTVPLLRRGEEVEVRMVIVEVEGGDRYTLWEGANLTNFFDAVRVGQEILVRYKGEQSLSGGRSMKTYDAFIR